MISDISIKSKCPYSCSLCKKEYTRKGSLDKHTVLCEFKSKSRLELQVAVEEASDKPTYDQLVQIVQELSIKYVKMEEKQQIEQMLAMELRNHGEEMDEGSYKQSAKDGAGRTRM